MLNRNDMLGTDGCTAIQRAANRCMKCPLEKSSTSLSTSRAPRSTQSAAAFTWAGDSPPGQAVAEKSPVRALETDILRAEALICSAQARPALWPDAGPWPKSMQTTGEHLGECQVRKPRPQSWGVALTLWSEGQIGKACMLTSMCQSSLVVRAEVDYTKMTVHSRGGATLLLTRR